MTKTITITEVCNMAKSGINTFSCKDNSPRGVKTILASQVKIGDKIILDNYFHTVVK